MKEIPLTNGFIAIVDDADFELVVELKWSACVSRGAIYATTKQLKDISGRRPTTYMHRLVMNAAKGQEIDHINGNSLDNRRVNLRFCTRAQNNSNKSGKYGAVPFKGVYMDRGRFRANISKDGTRLGLGAYATAEEAARAYDIAAIKLHGPFASLNFPGGHQ